MHGSGNCAVWMQRSKRGHDTCIPLCIENTQAAVHLSDLHLEFIIILGCKIVYFNPVFLLATSALSHD